jgi:hypothetical protein
MDPVRESAVAGAVLGIGVALLGICVMGIAASHETAVQAPRPVIGLVGLGLVFCGAAFATVTARRRLALTLAIPGASLAFLLPMGWFALAPATRECTVFVMGGVSVSVSKAIVLDAASCHWVIVAAALMALVVVGGMLFAWFRLGRPGAGDGR